MNWLSSIDNILEHGLVRRRSDDDDESDYSESTSGSDGLDESSTDSEGEGESSSHHVQPSFGQSSTIDEDEDEGKVSEREEEEDDDGKRKADNNRLQSPPPQPLQRTIQQQQKQKSKPGTVRPGQIRLRLKRSVSSSSEEDSEEENDESGEGGEVEELDTTAAIPGTAVSSNKQKPEPIPISDHESLLSSLKASKSSNSTEDSNPSGLPMSVQDSDTSSTNLSPLSQTDVQTNNVEVQGTSTPQLSYVSKIKSAIATSQEAPNSTPSQAQRNHLESPIVGSPTSPSVIHASHQNDGESSNTAADNSLPPLPPSDTSEASQFRQDKEEMVTAAEKRHAQHNLARQALARKREAQKRFKQEQKDISAERTNPAEEAQTTSTATTPPKIEKSILNASGANVTEGGSSNQLESSLEDVKLDSNQMEPTSECPGKAPAVMEQVKSDPEPNNGNPTQSTIKPPEVDASTPSEPDSSPLKPASSSEKIESGSSMEIDMLTNTEQLNCTAPDDISGSWVSSPTKEMQIQPNQACFLEHEKPADILSPSIFANETPAQIPQGKEAKVEEEGQHQKQHFKGPLEQSPVSSPVSPPTPTPISAQSEQSNALDTVGEQSKITLSRDNPNPNASTEELDTSSPAPVDGTKPADIQVVVPTSTACSPEQGSTPIQSNTQQQVNGVIEDQVASSHSENYMAAESTSPPSQQPTSASIVEVSSMWSSNHCTEEATSSQQPLHANVDEVGQIAEGENNFPSNPASVENASVSSGWSWPWAASQDKNARADSDNENDNETADDGEDQESRHQQQTIIEAGFLKEAETQQQEVAKEVERDSHARSDDIIHDEAITSKSKVEEQRSLVDAESTAEAVESDQDEPRAAYNNPPHGYAQRGFGQASFHDVDGIANHNTSNKNKFEDDEEYIPNSTNESAEGDGLIDVRENKHRSGSSDWIPPQSERTLVAANLEPANLSTKSCNGDPIEASEPSSSLVEEEDANAEDDKPKADPGNNQSNLDDEDDMEARQDPKLFEVEGATGAWREDPTSLALEPVNCYGAFHIRVLRAQRLPCPGGSTVQANVSLPPWKGRDRTHKRKTFLLDSEDATFDHGVCAQFDENNTLSLVHAYASDATPIPKIKMELMFCSLLEFSICSLTLPCDILMKRPGSWTRQWFLTEVPDAKTAKKDGHLFGDDQVPMVELEAVFVPEDQSLGNSFVALDTSESQHVANGNELDIDQVPSRNRADTFGSAASDSIATKLSEADKKNEAELVPSGKPHLLRYKKFWKPAICGQCSKSLLGWKTKSFGCEVCGLDCCEDCRLHLDVQIPCGSSECKDIVSKAIQNKLTLNSFMEAMAPVDEEYKKKRELVKAPADGESSLTDTKTDGGTVSRAGEKGRIGVLKLNIARACVFSTPIPAVSEPEEVIGHDGDLRPGDYYVRVCRSGGVSSARTRTIPSGGNLKFEEGSEMRLDVAHYDVSFFIEIVDAITDKPLGTSVLTTQGLLQQQRDLMIENGRMSILNFGTKPPSFKGKRHMTLELRAGVKSGVIGDFFVPSDVSEDQGKISGWVELSVGLEEDAKRLFGASPYECPAPPPDSLNINTLNLHISRLSDFVEDIVNLFATYQYVVSWKSPLLTGFAFVLFLAFTIRFDSEYVGCLPFLFIMMCMLGSAFSRRNAKNRFVQEEADEWKAAEKDIDVNYTLHRPIGRISISVSKGKNIRSRDLGLAGNVGCRIYLDPARFATEKQKERLTTLDKSAKTIHEIGSTESKFTTNPVWENINESEECRRLKQVLPHRGYFFETEEELAEEVGCEFPVLQPFRRVDDDNDENPHHFINAALESWKASPAAVVFQIRFRDILNMLPGSDHIFGEVAIPLATIVQDNEMSGWFQVLEVGTKDFARVDERPSTGQVEETPVGGRGAEQEILGHDDIPKVFLTLRWSPPEERLDSDEARETDREASVVIQEELLRWEATNREKDKLKQLVVGGSIGAFKTVSGFAGTLQVIQNFLGKVANTLEAVRNLLNFTDPYKSSLVLAVVTILWIVLSLLPTRLILLIAGLAQFGITGKIRVEKLLKEPGEEENDDDSSVASDLDNDEEGEEDAPIVWLKNAFRGLPTDEDLRKAYFWEGRRIGVKTKESYATEKRMARLQRLWRAQWHAMIKIRSDVKSKKKTNANSAWEPIFAVVQGRRFLWWGTVSDFDSGRPPSGRIFLAGHAGLSGLSPLEMREINPKDVPLVVGIFGKGLQGQQQKVTLLLPSDDMKDSLENVVIEASMNFGSIHSSILPIRPASFVKDD